VHITSFFTSLPHNTKDDNVSGVGSTKNERKTRGNGANGK
jgi:hypothetical protein